MFRIEKIGENEFYIKALGTFPPSVAKRFIKEFSEITEKINKFSVIIDGLDFIFLNLESFEIILDTLIKNNNKLVKSAWVISKNPPLDTEIQFLIKKAESPKRKIVQNLDQAKNWVGINKIIIE
ncbi:MAG: hypothetical protein ACXADU_15710 [Promethearchaeota archaeon]